MLTCVGVPWSLNVTSAKTAKTARKSPKMLTICAIQSLRTGRSRNTSLKDSGDAVVAICFFLVIGRGEAIIAFALFRVFAFTTLHLTGPIQCGRDSLCVDRQTCPSAALHLCCHGDPDGGAGSH